MFPGEPFFPGTEIENRRRGPNLETKKFVRFATNKRHSRHWIGDTILSCLRREQTLQPTCRYFWAFYFKRNWNHWPCLNKFGAIWFVDHWTTNRGLRPLLLVQCSPVGVPKYVHHFKLVLSMINGFKLWGRCAMNFIKLGWDHLFIK